MSNWISGSCVPRMISWGFLKQLGWDVDVVANSEICSLCCSICDWGISACLWHSEQGFMIFVILIYFHVDIMNCEFSQLRRSWPHACDKEVAWKNLLEFMGFGCSSTTVSFNVWKYKTLIRLLRNDVLAHPPPAPLILQIWNNYCNYLAAWVRASEQSPRGCIIW